MIKYLFLIGFLAALLLTSCETEGTSPCTEEREASTIISTFPDSVKAGSNYPVNVQYVTESSCGEFERFEVTQNNKSFEVKMVTKYTGCSCKLELVEHQIDYNIDIGFPGTYEFRFWLAGGDYDVRTVTVFE
ncbi:MAG: hypothetical protein ABJG68_15960 [Crocinitomicaceae bacterium]